MPQACSICTNQAKGEIDRALLEGVPMRSIAAHHGLSPTSLRRHRDRHLSRALGKAVEEKRFEIDADKLTAWVAGLQTKTLQLLERAEQARDLTNARGFIGEARRNLELLGRVAGILEPNAAVAIDARRQIAVLSGLSEEELRSLARGDAGSQPVLTQATNTHGSSAFEAAE
jgi:transposase-like protein